MVMKKYITEFSIVDKYVYNPLYFSLTLQHPDTLPEMMPGQFVEVEVRDCKEVMLRRPISIHDVDYTHNTLTLLIPVVGKGTRKLATLEVGDSLNLVYPLGQGFSMKGERVLLVGGGAGTAPLLYLAKEFNARGVRPTIILGGRSADLIPMCDVFKPYGNLGVATDDGSLGEKGLVTQHSQFKLQPNNTYDYIYTCGPTPMMKAVAREAWRNGTECEVSLENTMACGVGACLCCVCNTDEGHKCVCKEGPVFNIKQLTHWMEEK